MGTKQIAITTDTKIMIREIDGNQVEKTVVIKGNAVNVASESGSETSWHTYTLPADSQTSRRPWKAESLVQMMPMPSWPACHNCWKVLPPDTRACALRPGISPSDFRFSVRSIGVRNTTACLFFDVAECVHEAGIPEVNEDGIGTCQRLPSFVSGFSSPRPIESHHGQYFEVIIGPRTIRERLHQAYGAQSTHQCVIAAGTDAATAATDARSCTRLIVECRRTRRWQTAIRLLQAVLNRQLETSVHVHSAIVSACEHSTWWHHALQHFVSTHRAHELELDAIIFSAAISACGKGSLWLSALALLASMTKQQLLPNQVTYGALAAACEKAATWRAAIAILQHALQQDQTGLIINSSVLSACEKSTAWLAAVSLIRTLAASTRLDMIASSAVISCSEKAGRWLQAVSSLSRLLLSGISPSIATMNALVSACEWNGQWERALVKLTLLTRLLQPDVVSYTAATAACGASGKWLDAMLLWAAMRSGGVIANIIMHNSLISAAATAACGASGKWLDAMLLWAAMRSGGVCEESGQWEIALDMFEHKTPRRAYTTVTINSSISACTRGIRWNQALHIFGPLLQPQQRPQPTRVSFNSVLGACHQRWLEVLVIMGILRRRQPLVQPLMLARGTGAHLGPQDCSVNWGTAPPAI
eukprot:s1967_g9.t2